MKKCLDVPRKRRYNTKKDAETTMFLLGKEETLRIYKCACCKGWHLTSLLKEKS